MRPITFTVLFALSVGTAVYVPGTTGTVVILHKKKKKRGVLKRKRTDSCNQYGWGRLDWQRSLAGDGDANRSFILLSAVLSPSRTQNPSVVPLPVNPTLQLIKSSLP